MKFSRDSVLWTLGIIAALLTYLVADGRNPATWDYLSWVKFVAAVVATLMAKLANSPLESKTRIRMAHPGKTVIGLLLTVALAGTMACANKTAPLESAQVSHDSLALAQDLEAQLCWGVARVTADVPDRTHCTTDIAKTIGLTDARHQAINSQLARAFVLHGVLTKQLQQGITVDLTQLRDLINAIVAELTNLQQTADVTHLIATVKAGEIKK